MDGRQGGGEAAGRGSGRGVQGRVPRRALPEEAPAGWVAPVQPGAKLGTTGSDTFKVGKTFLYKVKGGIEFRGQNPSQAYLIHEDVARLAKQNFKEGDTAKVGWVIKDDVKFLTELDREAPKVAETQGEF